MEPAPTRATSDKPSQPHASLTPTPGTSLDYGPGDHAYERSGLSVILGLAALSWLVLWTYYAITDTPAWLWLLGVAGLGALQVTVRLSTPKQRLAGETYTAPEAIHALLTDQARIYEAALRQLQSQPDRVLALLRDLVMQPYRFRNRVVETLRLERKVTSKRVEYWFSIPPSKYGDAALGSILVPVLVPRKGKLYHQPRVIDSSGDLVYTLPQGEAQEIAAALLLAVAVEALGLPKDQDAWEKNADVKALLAWAITPSHELPKSGSPQPGVRAQLEATLSEEVIKTEKGKSCST